MLAFDLKKGVIRTDQKNCIKCGTPTSPGARFCESCGAPLVVGGDQPTEETQAPKPQAGGPTYTGASLGTAAYATTLQGPRLRHQSVGIRFAATLIDGLVLGAIIWILTLFVIGGTAAIAMNSSQGTITAAVWAAIASVSLLAIVLWFLYYTLLEGMWGQTLGKYLVKIKVVKEDGTPISYGDAAIRTILRIIDGLFSYLVGALLIWTSDRKQRLGDRLAHTVVIQLCDEE